MCFSIEKKDKFLINLLESSPFPSIKHIYDLIGQEGWEGLGLNERKFNSHTKKLFTNKGSHYDRARLKIVEFLHEYENYLDNDFITQLCFESRRELKQLRQSYGKINKKDDNLHSSHNERICELYMLNHVLHKLKYEVLSKEKLKAINIKNKESFGRGPDIQITNHPDYNFINIECMTPFINSTTRATKIKDLDKIRQTVQGFEKLLYRKIMKKLRIYSNYVKDNIVSQNDLNIICLSMSNFGDYEKIDYQENKNHFITKKIISGTKRILKEEGSEYISGIVFVKNINGYFYNQRKDGEILSLANKKAIKPLPNGLLKENTYFKI